MQAHTHTCRVSVTDGGGKGQCTTGRGPIIVLTQCSGVTRLCPAKCQRKAKLRGEGWGCRIGWGCSRVEKSLREWTRRERSEHGCVLYEAKDGQISLTESVCLFKPTDCCVHRASCCFCQAFCLGPWLCGGWEPCSTLSTPQELPGGAEGPTLPTSLSVSPTPTLSTQTLTSAALGLLPWVLPEPFVSLPPLHLSFHPSSLLSLSFVPRNSCPA